MTLRVRLLLVTGVFALGGFSARGHSPADRAEGVQGATNATISAGARRRRESERRLLAPLVGRPLRDIGSVGGKPHLRRIAGGADGDVVRRFEDNGAREVLAMHITARFADLPPLVVPPAASAHSLGLRGVIQPWIPDLQVSLGAGPSPAAVNWESVHGVLLINFVGRQNDWKPNNTFYRWFDGVFYSVALDTEATFDRCRFGSGYRTHSSPIFHLLAGAAAAHPDCPAIVTLSPRLRHGLAAFDYGGWRLALREVGVSAGATHGAERRLRSVAEVADRGIAALIDTLRVP